MDFFQPKWTFFPLSESAVLLDFGEPASIEKNMFIHQLAARLAVKPFSGFIEAVPAYTTLAVYYNPLAAGGGVQSYEQTCHLIEEIAFPDSPHKLETKTVELPVCYDEEFALDITDVAAHNGISEEEVIEKHTNKDYHIYFIGFAPGFPFLGGLDPAIATPRKKAPRRKIRAGSVGIAGEQTGVYPIDIPGGWQIIGRTPQPLLRLGNSNPTLLQPGDKIRFYPISKEEYLRQEDASWH
ncbi:5-oxoprolinase subunit PxpB [Virgibacillus senegalensis]|uniref:5-oxoprolinase subunit PxpB n=1 Tax=Virgibacillus senegalensis TaxID=1499679 RepID=UPI00069D7B09|nr:5-oxoprolinase subunit PxpB [Virgibacillus senegalensis]